MSYPRRLLPLRQAVVTGAVTPAVVGFVASARIRRRPYLPYAALRRLDPVHRSPLGIYVVSSHAEVDAALRHPHMGNDEAKADLSLLRIAGLTKLLDRKPPGGERGPFLTMLPELMLFRDPPDHTRLRRLVNRAFTPKRVEALNGQIERITADLIEPLRGKAEFDLMDTFAYPLPARVICELVGLPAEDAGLIIEHSRGLATGLDPSPMRTTAALLAADVAVGALGDQLRKHIADRRLVPRDDLLSGLVHAEEAGDRLSEEELVATVILLLIAGHETTANLVGNGIDALLRDPGEARRVREDESVARAAVEELLRFDSPVQITQRIALEAVELGGRVIPKGAVLILLIGAANHDPAVFAEPRRLDVSRSPNPHLSFSAGAHFCVGAALARLEAQIAVPALLRSFPGLHRTRPAQHHRPSFTIRSYEHLHLGTRT